MLNVVRAFATVAVVACTVAAGVVQAQERTSDVRTFAILPERVESDPNNPGQLIRAGHPEGITADADGNVYAATFDVGVANFIYIFDTIGALKVTLPFPEGRAPLGMVTDRQFMYVNDVLNGDLLRYNLPITSTSQPTAIYDVCGGFLAAFGIGAPGREFCALNSNDIGPDGREATDERRDAVDRVRFLRTLRTVQLDRPVGLKPGPTMTDQVRISATV